ncbi:DUF2867 domain-containing protein [Flavobacteriaceae bacterium Ap0902]|nr:DUF2867 domain-containing protein [Flavobacteriaceae bacterium Ap0902]
MKKILLTGATGYIGKRMISVISKEGYKVVCCTRERSRFKVPEGISENQIDVIEVDFLEEETLKKIPQDIDGAYYLMHSMSASSDYEEMEKRTAQNFVNAVNDTQCEHVIYLTGIVNEDHMSKHLSSRLMVEEILSSGSFNFTALRAGIVIGSGSASFEIIRDLVEKLPVMITPKWLNTKCQPIGIADVLEFLIKTMLNEKAYNNNYDIGCDDVLSYKNMLLGYAKVRGLKRHIYTAPVMTPKLSSYWLYFVTSTSYTLASALVDSMRIEVVCRPDKLKEIKEITGVQPISYYEALKRTLSKIQVDEIASSWKDSFVSSRVDKSLKAFIEVPEKGVFIDKRVQNYDDREACLDRIFGIGGANGWYGNFLWKVRGFMDQIVGGPGLRRGRRHPLELNDGDALDFWRVLYANREDGRLILFAEMKVPGEAWLSFNINEGQITQKAVFRPHGLMGRLYWYAVLPFHGLIFNGMVKKLAKG